MHVKNLVNTVAPTIPVELSNKLVLAATFELTEYEARMFNLALKAMVEQLKEEKVDFNSLSNVNAVFTNDGNISMSFLEGVAGVHLSLVIYAVGLWRKHNFDENRKLSVFIEELCHHYWRIEDEIIVKYKVFDIFKRIKPVVQFEQLFDIKSLK